MDNHLSKDFLTPRQIASTLQLNIITIYSYIKNKELIAIKFGRTYRVTKEDLNNFLSNHKTSASITI